MSKIKALVRDQLLFLVITFENTKVSFLIALWNGPIPPPSPPFNLNSLSNIKHFSISFFQFQIKSSELTKLFNGQCYIGLQC